MPRLFGTNGIRGIPGKDLQPELIVKIGHAVSARLGKKIAIGRDGRISSPMISELLSASLLESGSDVYDTGMLPTPALQFYTGRKKFDGSVMVTASHNPPEFNGIKVVGSTGVEVSRQVEKEIEALVFAEAKLEKNNLATGELISVSDAIDVYLNGITSHVDIEKIKAKKFKVVIDAGNGMQALAAPKLMEELGCTAICINCEVDGNFPARGSEPIPEKLTELAKEVRGLHADFGVAFDGDGDRAVFCDEKGTIQTGDKSGALLAYYVLSAKDKVVTTIATSNLIDWVAEKKNAKLIRTKVGSVDVTDMMINTKAKAGFEENGGFFFAPHQPVRDGAMTLALMLNALAEWKMKFSEVMAELPVFYQRKGKLSCPEELKDQILSRILNVADGNTDTTDGVKISYPDDSWVLVRLSGTEPIIRIFAESSLEARAEELYKKYITIVNDFINKKEE